MYSRNHGHEQKYTDYDMNDRYDDMSDDEYELYRYNLPPKYDGSRFRRNTVRRSPPQHDKGSDNIRLNDEHEEEAVCYECEEANAETESESDEQCERKGCEEGKIQSLLAHIGEHFGYEEILIIALILMIAGDGKADDDIILLLAVLLLGH